MSDNTNTKPDEENGSKLRYACYKDIPHTCSTCNCLIDRGEKPRICLYNTMDRVTGRHDETWYELPDNVNECEHWQTEEICADCKYAIDPRYHNEAVGYATFRCRLYHKTVIDIENACKRYRYRGGDMKT